MKNALLIFLIFLSTDSFARTLKASAEKLGADMSQIAFGLSIFGLVLAGIYFMLGRQDASQKMTQVLMGIAIFMLSPAILSFIKALA